MTEGDRRRLGEVPGLVNSTETFGTVDGPGIRYVQFLQGCPLRCLYCHNPEIAFCPGGYRTTAAKTVADIERYKNFIKSGGVTFSGGEPLIQAEYVEACSKLLHEKGFHIAIDTSGSERMERIQSAVDEADLIMLDIKAINPEVCLRLTGRDNSNAFSLLDYCEKVHKPVWIRHVLVRGYTLDEQQLHTLGERLTKYTCVERVEILPFHKLGELKWEKCGVPYKLGDVEATTKEEADWAREIIRGYGFTVQ